MFYDRFKQLCEKKGVKPTNACVEAGFSRGLAAKWKAEKTEVPRSDILQKLSVYFGMTIDEILGEEEQKEKTATIDSDDLDMRIRERWAMLTEQERESFLAQIDAVLKLRGD